MAKIQGRIIRILDNRTAIINLGKNHGITPNSVFHILGEPETIIDPFSEEELGQIAVVKSKLKAEQVYEKFTIATTRWTIETFKAGIFNNLFAPYTNVVETRVVDQGELRVRPEDLQPWKAQSETPVRVGDIVEAEAQVQKTSLQKEVIEEDEETDVDTDNEESPVDDLSSS